MQNRVYQKSQILQSRSDATFLKVTLTHVVQRMKEADDERLIF